MKEIRENIEIITKQSDQIKEKQIKHQQQQKEKNVERLINMEKLKKSVEKINSELSNIENIDGEGGLSAMQLSVICNITEQEAIDLINKYDIDGDGKLDYEEFKHLKAQIMGFQKQQRMKKRERDEMEQKYDKNDNYLKIEQYKKNRGKKNEQSGLNINYDAMLLEKKKNKEKKENEQKKAVSQRKELLKLNMNQLAKKCKELNLPSNGTKADIVNRLMNAQKKDNDECSNDETIKQI